MATGGTPPLSVDPEELSAAGGALLDSAAELPPAPAPFNPGGKDPLSAAITAQIPAVEVPIATQLPLIQAQATSTAQNVVNAAQVYAETDARNGAAIHEQMQVRPNAPGTGSGGGSLPSTATGGADSPGMPMQMAGQMGQMPMQVMGAVAAVPQGIMQGAQQAGQQVQQMVGQFGDQGAKDGQKGTPSGELPTAANPEEGAAAAEPHAERAPEAKEKADTEGGQRPGRHRAAESDERIEL
ncbi:hypothetical protein [Mycolicibacterium austroafricanum]|uniref:hypothetical protein n=1 Tax=Mycolicibacterium austroafricanum TaxID=39687 RepID=UPI001CA30FA8|nr:hypothetical protein [Mycolicibacterium austroafricanum]QZT62970.1 hypothetical protein JN085_00690 [Mycolicibacterium austroafricanum]